MISVCFEGVLDRLVLLVIRAFDWRVGKCIVGFGTMREWVKFDNVLNVNLKIYNNHSPFIESKIIK